MTSRVTLNVFSGRPNPTWLLSEQEEKQLADRLEPSQPLTQMRPSGVYGGLGYRGFSITRDIGHPEGAISLLVHQGIVDHQSGGSNVAVGSELESWLAETGRSHVPDVGENEHWGGEHVPISKPDGRRLSDLPRCRCAALQSRSVEHSLSPAIQ